MLVQSIIIIICVICSVQILKHNGSTRLFYFLWGITFCNHGVEILHHLSVLRILIFAFYISVFIRKSDRLILLKIPLRKQFVFILVAYLCTGLLDNRGCGIGFYKAILEYMETFGLIILGYVSIRHVNDLHKLLYVILKIGLCVSVYSIITYLIGEDIVNSQIPGTDLSMNRFSRIRIPSFYYSSHLSGAAISMMLVLVISLGHRWNIKYWTLLSALMFMALILTGSRSSILSSFVGLMFVYYYKNVQSHKVIFSILEVCFIGFTVTFMNRIPFLTDMFEEGGGETGGSNIFMRLQQLVYSYELFLQSPYFGNGFKYFWEVVKEDDGFLSSMLLGAESYLFILLIDRGLIQMVAIAYFFISLIRLLVHYRNDFFVIVCIGLAWAFLFHSVMTGNDGKWLHMTMYIGYGLSVIGIYRNNLLNKI